MHSSLIYAVGTRLAYFSRSGHQFRNHGLEPAEIFPPCLGLGFHSGSDADFDCPRAAARRLVFSRTATICAPRDFRLGRAHAWSVWDVFFRAHRSGYGFPLIVIGVASAIFAAILFLRQPCRARISAGRAQIGARAGLAASMRLHCIDRRRPPQSVQDAQQFAAAQHLQAERVAALALPPTLTHWVGLVSTPEGVWRTTFHEPGGAIESSQLYAGAPTSKYIEQAKSCATCRFISGLRDIPSGAPGSGRRPNVVEISDIRFFRENVPDPASASQSTKNIPGFGPGLPDLHFK